MPEDSAPTPASPSSSSALSTPSSSSVGMLPGAFPARALGANLARYAGALATSSKSSVLSSTHSNSSNASSTYWGSVGSMSSNRKLGSFVSRSKGCGAEQDAAEQQQHQQRQLAGHSFKHQSSTSQEASFMSKSARASRTGSCPCDNIQQHMHYFSGSPGQPHSAEDAEVAAVTSGNGAVAPHSQPQRGLALLHHMELLLAHKTRDNGCTSAPPVLIPESSGSCTPCGRRSCNALELAAMAESYAQPLLLPAGKQLQQQQSYTRPFSTASELAPTTPAVHTANSSSSSLAQQLQQLSVASFHDTTQQVQQRVRQVHSALPARVQISREVKQQLLVEPPSSPQLLPHTHSRNCALVSAVPDSLRGLDLDHARSPPCVKAGPASPTGALSTAVQRDARSARPSRIGMSETASNSADSAADQRATTAVTQHDPVVLVLPASRLAPHHSSSYLPDGSQARLTATHTEGPRPASALVSAAAFAAVGLGRQVSATPNPAAGDTAAGITPAWGYQPDTSRIRRSKSHPNIPACQQQQQQQLSRQLDGAPLAHSPSSLSSRSLSACRSRGLGNSPSRSPSHGCHGPCLNTTNSSSNSSGTRNNSSNTAVKPAAGAAARRSSTGTEGRAGEPVGPLELDPCAPPLHTAKLSKPDLLDVEYIVHRWSHRWQCDRERQFANCSSVPVSAAPHSATHQQTAGAGAAVTAAAAGAAACSSSSCSSPVWMRPAEELHLFGASSLDAILQQRQ